MDDELLHLEAELKRLRPAEPSRELLARLDRELGHQQERRAVRVWWFWAGALPIAAALAVMLFATARREAGLGAPDSLEVTDAESRSAAPFQPVAAENVLYAALDEGFVTLSDGTTARRERLSYVDTITWKNPRTNASVRWSVPREEVRVVPVNFQ